MNQAQNYLDLLNYLSLPAEAVMRFSNCTVERTDCIERFAFSAGWRSGLGPQFCEAPGSPPAFDLAFIACLFCFHLIRVSRPLADFWYFWSTRAFLRFFSARKEWSEMDGT